MNAGLICACNNKNILIIFITGTADKFYNIRDHLYQGSQKDHEKAVPDKMMKKRSTFASNYYNVLTLRLFFLFTDQGQIHHVEGIERVKRQVVISSSQRRGAKAPLT